MDRMDFRGRGERRSHLVRLDRCNTAGLALWCVAAMRSQSAVDRCQAGEAWNTDWETHREIKQSKESNRFQTLRYKKEQIASSGNYHVLKAHLHHDPMAASWWRDRCEAEPAPRSRNSLLGGEEPPSLSPFPCLSFFFYYIIPASGFQLQPKALFFLPRNVVYLKPWLRCYSNVLANSLSVPCAFLSVFTCFQIATRWWKIIYLLDCNCRGLCWLLAVRMSPWFIYFYFKIACLKLKEQWCDLQCSWGRLLFAII